MDILLPRILILYLANRYSVDDSIFEVFYVEEGEAIIDSMTGESRTIKL